MPFTKVNINEVIEKKKREDAEFKKVWDDSSKRNLTNKTCYARLHLARRAEH